MSFFYSDFFFNKNLIICEVIVLFRFSWLKYLPNDALVFFKDSHDVTFPSTSFTNQVCILKCRTVQELLCRTFFLYLASPTNILQDRNHHWNKKFLLDLLIHQPLYCTYNLRRLFSFTKYSLPYNKINHLLTVIGINRIKGHLIFTKKRFKIITPKGKKLVYPIKKLWTKVSFIFMFSAISFN